MQKSTKQHLQSLIYIRAQHSENINENILSDLVTWEKSIQHSLEY